MQDTPLIPAREIEFQRRMMAQVKSLPGRPGRYFIVTMGCQMNARDSETLAGMLTEMGMEPAAAREDADLIAFNTCCVRENAENKALGNVIWLKELKKDRPGLLVMVGGCMAQESGMAQRIRRECPFVNVIFGTHNLHCVPEYLYRVLTGGGAIDCVEQSDGSVAEGLPARRGDRFTAFVNIMYGCNNFCSYCIVPYVRGRERSRDADDIIRECDALVASGAREVTLLGQNVNSYMGGGAAFARLLSRVDKTGIQRIRFMTSHPKDVSDELIDAFATVPHLMPQLHLPVQSGNDGILRQMNRRYDRAHYLALVDRLRAVRPDIGLTSDIIVGFPGETESQFRDTLELVRRVRYDSAFTFIYSPRVGTAAAKMPDPVSAEEKSERIQRLIALQQGITGEILQTRVGRTEQVLIEGESARTAGQVAGRTKRGHMVNFPGDSSRAGEFADVEITSAGKNTLRGREKI